MGSVAEAIETMGHAMPPRTRSWTTAIVPHLGTWAFGAAIAALIVTGWLNREDSDLTPETGLGYLLGIVGLSFVLLLLIYPLRKRIRGLSRIGSVKFWFRFHMMCGVLAPTAILFHANFHLGSLNSRVAFWSMMVVAASGLIGRYLYTQIHHGLYGERATLKQLTAGLDDDLTGLTGLADLPQDLRETVIGQSDTVRAASKRFLPSLKLLLWVAPRSHLIEWKVRRIVREQIAAHAAAENWQPDRQRRETARALGAIWGYFWTIRKISGFTFFERLFALWHVVHLPLFVILLLSAALHVVVVHAY